MGALRFAGLFLASRVALIAVVRWATRGSEISGDVAMHVRMMRAPIDPLLGRGPFSQHPPLLALVEGAVFRLFDGWLEVFLAVRATYVVFELVAALLVHAALSGVLPHKELRRSEVLLCVLPCGFMASCVMPQDECVAYAFMALAMFALARGRSAAALLALSFGVASAKLLLLIPLLVCVVLLRAPVLPVRLACAIVPIACSYALAWFAAGPAEIPAVLRFAPPAAFSVNAWALVSGSISPDLAKSVSSALGLALASIPLLRARSAEGRAWTALFSAASAAIAWFLVGFYHVNPEYLALLAPALAFGSLRGRAALLAFGATILPWLANFAYGIRYCVVHGTWDGAKGAIARRYLQLGLIDPTVLHAIATLATTLAVAALAWSLQRRTSTPSP